MRDKPESPKPIVTGKWIALYIFATIWILLVATLDASHFGPGFFPTIISIFLVPLLAVVFAIDLCIRIAIATERKEELPLKTRLWPVLIALAAFLVYGGIIAFVIMEQAS
ncbi:MAG: hypothetical protein OEM63_01395 [Gammaproteobacteria bacterium]|nr:hypothetical protein [Gammaproteobacteria bacterium]